MKTPPISPADRREIDALRAEIRHRPGYRLARAWLGQRLVGRPPTAIPTEISRVSRAIECTTGAVLHDETTMVALEDAGYPVVKLRRHRSELYGEVSIDERAILDVAEDRWRGCPPPRPWGRIWGDDVDGGTRQ